MKNELRAKWHANNSSEALAGIMGHLFGLSLLNSVLLGIEYSCHASTMTIYVTGGLITLSVAIGSAIMTFLVLADSESEVMSGKSLAIRVLGTIKYTLYMPLVIPAILILLFTWKWIYKLIGDTGLNQLKQMKSNLSHAV